MLIFVRLVILILFLNFWLIKWWLIHRLKSHRHLVLKHLFHFWYLINFRLFDFFRHHGLWSLNLCFYDSRLFYFWFKFFILFSALFLCSNFFLFLNWFFICLYLISLLYNNIDFFILRRCWLSNRIFFIIIDRFFIINICFLRKRHMII